MPQHTVHRRRRPRQESHGKNHPFDLVICYDTTGSMSDFIEEIKSSALSIMDDVMRRIPNLKLSIFVHKDYDDEDAIFVYKYIDFTADKERIRNFIGGTGPSGGGGAECYELALHKVRTELAWREGSQRALLIVGDQCPHEPAEFSEILGYYKQINEALDWRLEVHELLEQNCYIYPLKYGTIAEADYFWTDIALMSETYKATLFEKSQFQQVVSMTICKAKGGKVYEEYKAEVNARYVGKSMPDNLRETLETFDQKAGSLKAARAGSSVTVEEVSDADYQRRIRNMRENVTKVRVRNAEHHELARAANAGGAAGARENGVIAGAAAGATAGAVIAGPPGAFVGGVFGAVGGYIRSWW